MNAEEWLLLGFDARSDTPDVTRRSVDADVWPSVFDRYHIERPAWWGAVQTLWEDRSLLEDALTKSSARESGPLVVVAVAVAPTRCSRPIDWRGRLASPPSQIAASWRFLGYDVADEYLESALDGALSAHAITRPRTNALGLIPTLADAELFLESTTAVSAATDVYCIFGLWEVERAGAGSRCVDCRDE
jgi:hypothetical protein